VVEFADGFPSPIYFSLCVLAPDNSEVDGGLLVAGVSLALRLTVGRVTVKATKK